MIPEPYNPDDPSEGGKYEVDPETGLRIYTNEQVAEILAQDEEERRAEMESEWPLGSVWLWMIAFCLAFWMILLYAGRFLIDRIG